MIEYIIFVPPILIIVGGIFFLLKPDDVARYFQSYAQSIGRQSEKDIPLLEKQKEQLTARPIVIRVVGFVLFCIGVFMFVGFLLKFIETS